MQAGVGSPFSSIEVRWFFDSGAGDRNSIKQWFEEYSPFERSDGLGPVQWLGRQGGEPDAYLLLPGYEDMGIKWREGTLQVKGLVADAGPQRFGDGHDGRVQRWIKWTYAEAPAALRALFQLEPHDGGAVVRVSKTRAVRLIEIGPSGVCTEVAPSEWVQHGIGFEMTDLQVGERGFFTIAFEAFPDSQLSRTHFNVIVGAVLEGLRSTRFDLAASMSYPAWLNDALA